MIIIVYFIYVNVEVIGQLGSSQFSVSTHVSVIKLGLSILALSAFTC